MKRNEFDAIVIGSGISGGWAAKELCEKGLKTLWSFWLYAGHRSTAEGIAGEPYLGTF